jgi:4-hydroxythreonine-4-phosphate dehydrogenase
VRLASPSIPRILITPGEPAGIGPDVVIQMAAKAHAAELIVVGSPELMRERAEQLNIPLSLEVIDWSQPPRAQAAHQLKIFPVELNVACVPGTLNVENADYVIHALELAALFCLHKKADALVTGPVQKSIINAAQIPFTGHTEFLAGACHAQTAIMLFVIDKLKVALVTTHIPLAQVSQAITKDKLEKTLRTLHLEMQKRFHLPRPKISVCGLNPHAGESGNLGREEIEIITPVLDKLRAEGMELRGPLPADTAFTGNNLTAADVIVAMYHDQALPVVKHIGFDRAVNVTLGLPIIRTSVDHGTALDLAGTGKADAGSLEAALRLAIELCE